MTLEATAPAGVAASTRAAFASMLTPLADVFRSRNLRRIEIAFAGSIIGDWAFATAVTVWAYGVGGARAVGLWTAGRMLAMALSAPFVSAISDRLPRKWVMVGADLLRAILVVAATVCLWQHAPAAAIFVIAGSISVVSCAFRPAQAAILPALSDTPEQLTAANGASSTIESLGFFAGPALGALLLNVGSVETVFLVEAATFVWSAAFVSTVRPRAAEARGGAAQSDADGSSGEREPGVAAGFTTIARDPKLLLITFITCAQTIIAGASAVFMVLMAVNVLKTGPTGVGWVNSVFGVGAIIGGFVAMARSRHHRQGSDLAVGTLLWSLPLLLVAWQPLTGLVFASMALLGFGNPLVDVAFFTIVQRITPDRVMSRVFGALDGLMIGAMGIGALVMPWLVHLYGFRSSLAILALAVAIPVLLLVPATRKLDATLRPPAGLELLRNIAMFAPLSPGRLEAIAHQMERVTLPAGYTVLQEGGASDRFYVIERGAVEVTQGGTLLRTEGAGDFFGEIGLLRDVARTATVTTTSETDLLTLSRAAFLAALDGSDESVLAADDIITRRLGV